MSKLHNKTGVTEQTDTHRGEENCGVYWFFFFFYLQIVNYLHFRESANFVYRKILFKFTIYWANSANTTKSTRKLVGHFIQYKHQQFFSFWLLTPWALNFSFLVISVWRFSFFPRSNSSYKKKIIFKHLYSRMREVSVEIW